MKLQYSHLRFGPYSMIVEYDDENNTIIVTSKNDETFEVFENVNFGDLKGVVKFDASTVGDYIAQSWGRFLPAFDEKIGFIYSVEDLDIRKDLLTELEYAKIRGKYPYLPQGKGTISTGCTQSVRIISYVKSAELDIKTGEVVAGSTVQTIIDNTDASWYSASSVPVSDLNEVASEFVDAIKAVDPTTMHYFDPIEAAIWRKYGKKE